ncbi:homing endonuclease associated repeat-containing protein [Haloplanus halophilus]|uniref:homing endonuclease associated repeat-containing protein n=1 Tax=Haloplanus halophilus TaxID=2949993 RepID=UPI00203F672C|nr:HNH endonuclease [Haloplanus sp. GDY1]
MASRAELLGEIKRLAAMNGAVPRLRDMNEQGRFSERPYWDEFESWTAAVEAADLDVDDTRGATYSDDELLRDLQAVADEDKSVTRTEYRRRGAYSAGALEDRFGSWNGALRAAGLPVNRRSAVEVTCDECGETFTRPKCHLEREWTTHTFCSPECHGEWREGRIKGREHPQFDPSAHDDYSENWGVHRKQAIRRDDEQCVRCGMGRDQHRKRTGRDLHVHHITPRSAFDEIADANQIDNLITLCASCHADVEHGSVEVKA